VPYLAPSAIDFLPVPVLLLVCTRAKQIFPRSKLAPLNLRPERRVGEKQWHVVAKMIHGAILQINYAATQLTEK
jgi:hypothetical protein